MEISKKKLLELHRDLMTARRLDEKLFELIEEGGTGMPFLNRGTGEEAVAIGICHNLRKDDYLLFRTRQIPFIFSKGKHEGRTLKDVIASECVRDVPKSGGHGTYYFIDPDFGVLGRSHSLSEDVNIYLGSALQSQMRKLDKVTVIQVGDGGASRGPLHEAMVVAAAWSLPVIFVLNNNQYAVGTSSRRDVYKIKDFADRGRGYGIPSESVDGNDVIAVYETVKKYVDKARRGGGPGFIATETYRLSGHSTEDKQLYRPKGELEEWWKKDPLPRFQKKLMAMGILTAKEINKLEAEVKEELEEATKEALAMPYISYEDYIEGAVVDVL